MHAAVTAVRRWRRRSVCGYPLAADIFTAINTQSTPPLALPAYPFQLLWEDSLKALGLSADTPVRAALKKYSVPLSDAEFTAEALPVWRIYLLQSERQIAIKPISGLQKLDAIKRLLYHAPFQEADQARSLVALARNTEVFTLQRPFSWDLATLVSALEAHLGA